MSVTRRAKFVGRLVKQPLPVANARNSLSGLALILTAALSGCATIGSSLSHKGRDAGAKCVPAAFEQFERGRPNLFVDGVGWVFGIPRRIAYWNWDVENHQISLRTEQQLHQYLATNDLDDVKVRLNQYDPVGEWRRLRYNQRMAPGWRYTVGGLTTLGYTIFPGRLFGADNYNPFTNTVNVYSDVPALGLVEAGYAKDVHHRSYPGTYATVQLLPVVSVVHETVATSDVLDYTATHGNLHDRNEAVHVLYPRYGGVIGGAVESIVPAGGVIEFGGLLAGHATGRIKTWRQADTTPPPALATEPTDGGVVPASFETSAAK